MHEIHYHKFTISNEESGLSLTSSFILFKIEFSLPSIRHATVCKQLSTANNIFKASSLAQFSFIERIEKFS